MGEIEDECASVEESPFARALESTSLLPDDAEVALPFLLVSLSGVGVMVVVAVRDDLVCRWLAECPDPVAGRRYGDTDLMLPI